MLIIKKPIELKSRESMCTLEDNFCHKIRANYSLLTSDLGQEDLMHMVTMPPELYLAEGNTTTFIHQNSVYENKEIKVDVLNNLLNRISLTEEMSLTYQDKVYIDVVLRKLGIHNTKEFLEQVKQVKEINESMEKRITSYWNYLNQPVTNETHLETVIEPDQSIWEENKEEVKNYLHESIMNRLHTGLIYQVMDNFNSIQLYNSNYVSNQKLLLSQQKKTARQIFLNQLENYISEQEVPFIYLEKNSYEHMEATEENFTDERVNNQISKAVLYQLINSLHLERITSKNEHKDFWIDVRHSLYQTAENTLFRMQNEVVREGENKRREQLYLLLQKERESSLAKEVIEHREAVETIQKEIAGELTEAGNTALLPEEAGSIQEEVKRINERKLEQLPEETKQIYRLIEEYTQSPGEIQGVNMPGNNPDLLLQDTHLIHEEMLHHNKESVQAIKEEITEEIREERNLALLQEDPGRIREELKRINERNLQRMEYYQSLKKNEEARLETRKRSLEEIRRESLQALSDPERLLLQYRTENERQQENAESQKEKLLERLPEETKQIYHLIEEYTRNPAAVQGMNVSKNNLGLLFRDAELIHEDILTQKKEVEAREQSKQEISHEVLEKWKKNSTETRTEPAQGSHQQDIHLIHKQPQQYLEEEQIQEVLERNREQIIRNTTQETLFNETKRIHVQKTEERNTIKQRNNEELAKMIDSGVKKQLGSISDQVYRRLEKKLYHEKRRRGI